MAPVTEQSQYGEYRFSVAAYIFRELWVARCRATIDSASMRAREICLKVIYRVQLLTLVTVPEKASTMHQGIILGTLGVTRHPVRRKKDRWCKWDKPSPGWFKVNIDGSERGGLITRGGVIRDHDGTWYGAGSNNLAEFVALRDGLKLCKEVLHFLGLLLRVIQS